MSNQRAKVKPCKYCKEPIGERHEMEFIAKKIISSDDEDIKEMPIKFELLHLGEGLFMTFITPESSVECAKISAKGFLDCRQDIISILSKKTLKEIEKEYEKHMIAEREISHDSFVFNFCPMCGRELIGGES